MNERATRLRSLALTCLLALPSAAQGSLIENFDGLSQTAQPSANGYALGNGWTGYVSGLAANPNYAADYYAVTTPSYADFDTRPSGANPYPGAALSPDNIIADIESHSDSRDNQQNSFLVQSPGFALSVGDTVTANLTGGQGQGTQQGTAPTSVIGIGGFGGSPIGSNGNGFEGLVIVDSAGNVVASGQRSGQGTLWELITLSVASPVVGETYHLDLINTFSSGWGWVAMDNVQLNAVPEPAALTLMIFGVVGLLAVARRRSAN